MDNLQRLKESLREAHELAQNKNPLPEDLDKINKLWEGLPQWDSQNHAHEGSMSELILDLQILNTTGGHLGKFIKNLQATSNPFSPAEYALKLRNLICDNHEFIDGCVRIINRAPGLAPLLNTFNTKKDEIPVLQERKKNGVKRVRNEVANSQTPDKVEHIEENNETVDKKVRQIVELLKSYEEPIPFYEFVLHTDFGKTVENIFYLSFVIRDGLATMDIIDGELVIFLTRSPTFNPSRGQKNQMVFSIDYEEWEKLIQDYNIREPMIP